ncbi:tyrosine-type recombinase/integrase [Phaeobacter gallaeciensis]|uniref:Site-specific recombinase XerD n=1 Tax=Phaeobacter gallaeciensis TaxID=60890 RepID=A0AAC9Z611_9RHOB|nr:tyrosine-type recombinase/integrase [Phaeobacter gallaeciensis]AHD07939.1 Site-specific recombinase XerD [Phaeobacter gallaeciensis DSM 26640]ATE91207.1 Site-specific recombinase XerD [Phaeobacter gallaeciensis]ATE95482.1 Site-specific recombinase XerD [Phaeobacter gallaeciensis]ATE99821.1 Site-specific recombinase XerD [Phaeobacter gallaeciensis]ATF04254.1 Site-specific recombinase XerD [Phaeobacter gallaeciensis]
MTFVRVKGFKIFADRHGQMRCYHRGTNQKVDLTKSPLGSVEFFADCARISAAAEAMKELQPKPGTLGGLFAAYFAEEHYLELSDATKREYRMCAEVLKNIRDTPVTTLDTPLLAAIHDELAKKHSWDKANRVRNFLIQVFRFCIPKGLISRNFAEGVIKKPRPKGTPEAYRTWTFNEVQTVLEAASPQLRAALAMIFCTGQDPSDALEFRKDQVDDGVIWKGRNKTNVGAAIPISGILEGELEKAPVNNAETLLASSKGTPWTYDGFASAWQRLRKKLEKAGKVAPGLTPKGLRHTMATWLREAGQDEREISDLLAQDSKVMGLHYSKNAALARKNRKTMQVWEGEYERRAQKAKLSNPQKKPSNPDKEIKPNE